MHMDVYGHTFVPRIRIFILNSSLGSRRFLPLWSLGVQRYSITAVNWKNEQKNVWDLNSSFMVRLFGTPSSRKDDVLSQWCLLPTYWGKNFETIFWIAVVSCESMLPFFCGIKFVRPRCRFWLCPGCAPLDVTWENKKGAWTVSAEITKEHEFQFSHTEAWMMLEEWQDW